MKNQLIASCAAFALLGAAACDKTAPAASSPATSSLSEPSAEARADLLAPEAATQKAPPIFKSRFATTQGDFVLEVHRDWAPNGADRFYNLVKMGFFDGAAFFRVIDGFMAQVGIHGDPAVSARWRPAAIADDPPAGQSNQRGMASFAMAGPNTRTTQFFLNFRDNSFLDHQGFPPFGRIVEGIEVLDKLHRGYGEGAPSGSGPDQGRLQMQGNAYLKADFPLLDSIKTARLVP